MSKQLFGTDGIRGRAGQPPLDLHTVIALGISLAEDLKKQSLKNNQAHPDPVLIAMDTRMSGPVIAAQLANGFGRLGVQCAFAGVLPTPGLAYLTRTGAYSAGAMISASHNPFEDNGIKIFGHSGFKLPDAEEHEIEEAIFRHLPTISEPGAIPRLESHIDTRPYLDFLLSTLQSDKPLAGLKIVMDCGNGAASAIGPELFTEAGANVIAIHNKPDGRNINDKCGALHLEDLRSEVLKQGADAGVAFDGDADRAMLIAPSGRVIDGDAVLLIAARRMKADGHLACGLVVSTVMSNLGLEKALQRHEISMLRTPVGDKYVLEEMVRREAPLGGEQSGHVIFREHATTGDGMLTALKVLETTVREHKSLDELAKEMVVYPQLLVNVKVRERRPLEEIPAVMSEIRASEAELAGFGRILVRYSGTEPLLRVMVEGPEQQQVERVAERVAAAIRSALA